MAVVNVMSRKKEEPMFIQPVHLRKAISVVLLSGILIGVAGMGEPTFSATDPVLPSD